MKKLILRLRLTRELSGQNNTGKTLYAVTCDSDAGEGGAGKGKSKKKGAGKNEQPERRPGKPAIALLGKFFVSSAA